MLKGLLEHTFLVFLERPAFEFMNEEGTIKRRYWIEIGN